MSALQLLHKTKLKGDCRQRVISEGDQRAPVLSFAYLKTLSIMHFHASLARRMVDTQHVHTSAQPAAVSGICTYAVSCAAQVQRWERKLTSTLWPVKVIKVGENRDTATNVAR